MIGAARLRKGAVMSARGAQHLVAEALGTARACGAGGPDGSGLVLVRGDSAFYCHAVIATARRGGARFSITARLIVRRVKRLNPASVPAGQGELCAAYRHHAVFTDSPQPMLQAETTHRQHAVIEQVNADLKAGPVARGRPGS